MVGRYLLYKAQKTSRVNVVWGADCALKYPVYLCGAVCAAQGLILAAEGRFLENVFVF